MEIQGILLTWADKAISGEIGFRKGKGGEDMDFGLLIRNLEFIKSAIMTYGLRAPGGELTVPYFGWVKQLDESIARARKLQEQGRRGG